MEIKLVSGFVIVVVYVEVEVEELMVCGVGRTIPSIRLPTICQMLQWLRRQDPWLHCEEVSILILCRNRNRIEGNGMEYEINRTLANAYLPKLLTP